MAGKEFTVSPDVYRVDVVPDKQGNSYRVMRCEVVARFDDQEHAAFLVDLLTRGQHDGSSAESVGSRSVQLRFFRKNSLPVLTQRLILARPSGVGMRWPHFRH